MEFLYIFIGAVLVNNFVLVRFLGLCPFLGVSQKLSASVSIGVATIFVLTLSSAIANLIYTYLLYPYSLEFLKSICFIVSIAILVGLTESVMQKFFPLLHKILGIYLPLITTNCAVLGVSLLVIQKELDFIDSVFFGFSASFGFLVVMVIFAGLRNRLDNFYIPKSFKGVPIALVTAGIMSMAFMGFSGLGGL